MTYTNEVLEAIDLWRTGIISWAETHSRIMGEVNTEGDRASAEALLLMLRSGVL